MNLLLGKHRSKHPNQAPEHEKPSDESYKHGPAALPTIVITDNGKASNKEQSPIEVNENERGGIVNMVRRFVASDMVSAIIVGPTNCANRFEVVILTLPLFWRFSGRS